MPADILDADTIYQQMPAPWHDVLDITVLGTVDSTNLWCRRQVGGSLGIPFACLAEQQTQGRGRRGRRWHSPAGGNLYLSLAWCFERDLSQLGLLPLLVGQAVCDTLRGLGVDHVTLKWPNDVLVEGRKIAGVLVETAAVGLAQCVMIIGVGVNVRMPGCTAKAAAPGAEWTDLSRVLPAERLPRRNVLAAKLLQALLTMCRQYVQQPDICLRSLQQTFAGEQAIEVITAQGERLQGTMLGISERGECRVRIDGRERRFSSADISLRTKPGGEEPVYAGHG